MHVETIPGDAASTTANVADAAASTDAPAGENTGTPSEGGEAAKPAADAGDPAAVVDPPGDAPADPPAAEEHAPEQYEDFVVPDDVVLEPERVGKFKELAKSWDLPQAKAQQLVDLGSELVSETLAGIQAAADAEVARWPESTRADPEVGGLRYDESVAHAQAALAKFGSPEFSQMLIDTRFGDHPEWVRFAARVGRAISETGFIDGLGSETVAEPTDPTERLAARVAAEQARNPARPQKQRP